MTPEQKIKREIILGSMMSGDVEFTGKLTADNVDEIYESELIEKDMQWDAESEFRCSGEQTAIECDDSRHYESYSVARKLSDGSWVGWTYWHGGGKYGEPDTIDWMNLAYNLSAKEELKTVTVVTFKKKK